MFVAEWIIGQLSVSSCKGKKPSITFCNRQNASFWHAAWIHPNPH